MIHNIEWNGGALEIDDEDRILVFTDKEGVKAMMYMPGYHDIVMIPVSGSGWYWNGSRQDPTFSPSILDPGGGGRIRNHVFVRDGTIEYLSDCAHDLAGKRLRMPKLKDWPNELKFW